MPSSSYNHNIVNLKIKLYPPFTKQFILKVTGHIFPLLLENFTLVRQIGQQDPSEGGRGLTQASTQMVSLQTSLPPESHLQAVQASGSQEVPSGCVVLCRSMHVARHRQTCLPINVSNLRDYHNVTQ